MKTKIYEYEIEAVKYWNRANPEQPEAKGDKNDPVWQSGYVAGWGAHELLPPQEQPPQKGMEDVISEIEAFSHMDLDSGIDMTALSNVAEILRANWPRGYSEKDYERMEDALQQIHAWCRAYPEDIFIPMTSEKLKRAHELLQTEGMTVDAISASAGRHILKGIIEYAERGLSAGE